MVGTAAWACCTHAQRQASDLQQSGVGCLNLAGEVSAVAAGKSANAADVVGSCSWHDGVSVAIVE